jgi:hypothetical protein
VIQILHGSIFDLKCDLLIIPCNSFGGVTRSVYNDLKRNELPLSVGVLEYGSIYYQNVRFAYSLELGYAASVNGSNSKSDYKTIEKIARNIVEYSKNNQISIVNVPLLGTGAGELSFSESYQALSSVFVSEPSIQFNIFCYTREIYNYIIDYAKKQDKTLTKSIAPPPRVFISYTASDDDSKKWAKGMADYLRSKGVNARIDIYHLKPGDDLPYWMTNEVIMADKVILICDYSYIEKADFKKGGVGWETMIIQGDMLHQGNNKSKYIAIMREDNTDKTLPIYVSSKYAISWLRSNSSSSLSRKNYRILIEAIFDIESEPPIGTPPDYIKGKNRRV